MHFNVWLLALCQSLAFAVVPMLMFIGSLIGAELATNPDLATLPIAAMVVGTAVGTVPTSIITKQLGRKYTYILFTLVGTAACGSIGLALELKSFLLFCISTGIIGICLAAIQQFRFAAMESVAMDKGPSAASIVLLGGVIAAVIGPELAVMGKTYTNVEYQGSFWLAGASFLLASLFLLLLRSTASNTTDKENHTGRSLGAVFKNNRMLWLAIGSGAAGYAIMTFVMTATPISMHHHHGHSLVDTKWVIQSHISAMFLPSLITPFIIRKIGIKAVMLAGLACYGFTIVIGLADTSVMGYWSQLIMLGIGWNFLFVAGTSLLPLTYQTGEQFKIQGVNDGIVFTMQAFASLTSGLIISNSGWSSVLLLCIPPMVVMLLLLWMNTRSLEHAATNS